MENSILHLLQEGLATIAKEPATNTEHVLKENGEVDEVYLEDLERYTVTLIDHDYTGGFAGMWNAVYERAGVRMRSIMLIADPQQAQKIYAILKKDPKYAGGGAGSGFKDVSLSCMDCVDERTKVLGSVNIIKRESNGDLIGYNTDALGYVTGLEKLFEKLGRSLHYSNLLVFGAGGVAQPIIAELATRDPSRIVIVNRTKDKAQAIADIVNNQLGREVVHAVGEDKIEDVISTFDFAAVINVSNKGTFGKLAQWSAFGDTAEENATQTGELAEHSSARRHVEMLVQKSPDLIVSDINLLDEPSTTLKVAKWYGVKEHHLQDGNPMVVYQGIPAFLFVHEEEILPKDEIEQVMAHVRGLSL